MTSCRILPENCNTQIGTPRIQISSDSRSLALGLKLLYCLSSQTEIETVEIFLDHGCDELAIRSFTELWQIKDTQLNFRKSSVKNLFARDSAICLLDSQNNRFLLTPRNTYDFGYFGNNNRREKKDNFDIQIERSALLWEGGNILCDGLNCLVGANTIAQNMHVLSKECEWVIDTLSKELGYEIHILGDIDKAYRDISQPSTVKSRNNEHGQADFHIDLDICPLGDVGNRKKPIVLIADYQPKDIHLDEILSQCHFFRGHFLPPEQMKDIYLANVGATNSKRKTYLIHYQELLKSLGYDCISVPDFRLSQQHDYLGIRNFNFNFINTLPFLNRKNEHACLYLQYGLPGLETSVMDIFSKLGINASPVNQHDSLFSNDLLFFRGGLHCAVGKS